MGVLFRCGGCLTLSTLMLTVVHALRSKSISGLCLVVSIGLRPVVIPFPRIPLAWQVFGHF